MLAGTELSQSVVHLWEPVPLASYAAPSSAFISVSGRLEREANSWQTVHPVFCCSDFERTYAPTLRDYGFQHGWNDQSIPQGRQAEVIFSVLTISFPRGTARALIDICLLVSWRPCSLILGCCNAFFSFSLFLHFLSPLQNVPRTRGCFIHRFIIMWLMTTRMALWHCCSLIHHSFNISLSFSNPAPNCFDISLLGLRPRSPQIEWKITCSSKMIVNV